ncbi:MAG: GNAT family N-acetyltransferase [Micromonosporaceae bacterium]
MPQEIGWRELDDAAFADELDAFVAVYSAAMSPPADQLPGRRAIMERHATYPRFRGVAAWIGEPSTIVGFAYGFHGENGQWWHDMVLTALIASGGRGVAGTWLGDSFEIGEVHVDPRFQGRGIGRHMVLALAAPRAERTAVLSTRDTDSPARRLYRKLGFTDLLTAFCFPGAPEPYAIMGAALPLRCA